MLRPFAALLLFPMMLPAQTVLDGVYTEAQAMRGEAQYQMSCAGCHGQDLYGRAMGALRGDKFLDRWREDNLDVLFTHIRTRMPAPAPGTLKEGAYLDILAYILQVNGFPAGGKELASGALGSTKLVGPDGPKPLGSNTLVQVVGCFTQPANNTWALVKATEPVRTRNPEEITAEEIKSASAKPLGVQTLRLQNLEDLRGGFHADSYQGHKVDVKGVLLRGANNDRINVLSLATVAAACAE
jgi:S-disulfanyl-L-cysteine oxidoreductase SoxD